MAMSPLSWERSLDWRLPRFSAWRARSVSALALIAARILDPQSKLATAQGLGDESGWLQELSKTLGLGESVDEDDLYAAMDALEARQPVIEQTLAKRHLHDGSLVLYDLTSTYFHGHSCPIAKMGYSRDGKKGLLQITVGLLCTREGCPVAVEVFPGNSGDPSTFTAQVKKVKDRFGLAHVVYVGDRGMITNARIRDDLADLPGVGWITCLRAPAIQELRDQGAIQLTIFDQQDMAEITSDEYPGERLVVCRNPLLAEERTRKRTELLDATDGELSEISARVMRAKKPLRGAVEIGRAVERALAHHKVGKHYDITITDTTFTWARNQERIEREAELDGFYVIRAKVLSRRCQRPTWLPPTRGSPRSSAPSARSKASTWKIRPIYHRLEKRVRAHVLLCMLAYYVEFHMRSWLAPVLFQDDQPDEAKSLRESVVAPAERSTSAQEKASRKRSTENLPVHNFQSLLRDLSTISKNTIQPLVKGAQSFVQITLPTVFQRKAFELLQVPIL